MTASQVSCGVTGRLLQGQTQETGLSCCADLSRVEFLTQSIDSLDSNDPHCPRGRGETDALRGAPQAAGRPSLAAAHGGPRSEELHQRSPGGERGQLPAPRYGARRAVHPENCTGRPAVRASQRGSLGTGNSLSVLREPGNQLDETGEAASWLSAGGRPLLQEARWLSLPCRAGRGPGT